MCDCLQTHQLASPWWPWRRKRRSQRTISFSFFSYKSYFVQKFQFRFATEFSLAWPGTYIISCDKSWLSVKYTVNKLFCLYNIKYHINYWLWFVVNFIVNEVYSVWKLSFCLNHFVPAINLHFSWKHVLPTIFLQ